NETEAREYWKPAARFGFKWLLVGSVFAILTGHFMGQHVYTFQPQKFSAMMGICETGEAQKFEIVKTSSTCGEGLSIPVPIPGLESFMATNHFTGEESTLLSLDDTNAMLREAYGDATYYDADSRPSDELLNVYKTQLAKPNMMVSFWSFRIMMGVGFLLAAVSLLGLFLLRGERIYNPKGKANFWPWLITLPYIASTFGWILTEMGRQPFIVNPSSNPLINNAGNSTWIVSADGHASINPDLITGGNNVVMLLTDNGISGSVAWQSVLISLILFTAIYTILGVVWLLLLRRYGREGINPNYKTIEYDVEDANAPMSFAY
ncbi:MAG: cytochrome ubiquinol oxidase subunit I, partial [Actinomycetaceae bacterium]|nr:cytochrome ubiquinol oxidase subunit I [Actinomycetaceae bacterium]